ncbi:Major facilitator superfamily domain, general substrate transporter [Pseudocohnilembus persalinus]|uniref:Major facilitator superfamily domain, general substrate transporter n=1 Tax=Pseudocohnilembus persalinus TaxID=266149 RepID=A0A0V0R839_PSEPJ|nr:Major facilitator superfamily domain, general substrate transporter [Pseudocohnilembus persalinus]|eukprot:KRX10655.1 Major facilitator superfamily domain, general substrate transporter [Pseudocohnilembus persalinus]
MEQTSDNNYKKIQFKIGYQQIQTQDNDIHYDNENENLIAKRNKDLLEYQQQKQHIYDSNKNKQKENQEIQNVQINQDQNEESITYDKVLQQVGFGKYQLLIYLMIFLTGMVEGAYITGFSLLTQVFKVQWGIDDEWNSLGVSVVFVGILIGSLSSGFFSDKYGRKPSFMTVGFIIPVGASLITELTPKNMRGKGICTIILSINFGQLYGVFIGNFTIQQFETGSWRLFSFWAAFPLFFAIGISYYYLLESPLFLLQQADTQNQGFEVLEIINNLAQQQDNECQKRQLKLHQIDILECLKTKESDYLIKISKTCKCKSEKLQLKEQKEISLKNLFKTPDLSFITKIVWLNWFGTSFLYYGIILILPIILGNIDKVDEKDIQNIYKILAFSASSEILSTVFSALIIDKKGLGRKNSMILFNFLTGILSLLVYIDKFYNIQIWALFSKFFLAMTINFVYQFTAEIYPTTIRTTGIGVANSLGKMGGAFVPWLVLYMIKLDLLSPFLVFGGIALFISYVDYFIPYDTLGRDLN